MGGLCTWDRVPTGIPAGRVTLAFLISMARPSMADGRLQVPSSAHRCIRERSTQGTGTTRGHMATAPGGVALVNSGGRQVLRPDFHLVTGIEAPVALSIGTLTPPCEAVSAGPFFS